MPAISASGAGGRHGPAGRQQGLVAAELAIVFPVVLALVLGLVQFGLWYQAAATARAAAAEGVRAARAVDGSAEAGASRARHFLSQLGGGVVAPEVRATRHARHAVVEVRARAPEFVPGLRLPVRARAHSPLEVFRAETGG